MSEYQNWHGSDLDDEEEGGEDAGNDEEGPAHQEGQVEPTNLEEQPTWAKGWKSNGNEEKEKSGEVESEGKVL